MHQPLKVRILKENSTKVTVYFLALNRKMPVPKDVFEERVQNGTYQVLSSPLETESAL